MGQASGMSQLKAHQKQVMLRPACRSTSYLPEPNRTVLYDRSRPLTAFHSVKLLWKLRLDPSNGLGWGEIL